MRARAADDFEAIGKRTKEIADERAGLLRADRRRETVLRICQERGLPEGSFIPKDILLAAGYTQAQIDAWWEPVAGGGAKEYTDFYAQEYARE